MTIDDMEPVWMARARREIGVKETPGLPSNPRVLEYHACTRLRAKDDRTSWCSSWACWVFEGCDIRSTRSAAAISWLTWGQKLDEPQVGCVVVVERHDPKNPKAAHVALFAGRSDEVPPKRMGLDEALVWLAAHAGRDGKHLILLGGNQDDMVCLKACDEERVMGYRWPLI